MKHMKSLFLLAFLAVAAAFAMTPGSAGAAQSRTQPVVKHARAVRDQPCDPSSACCLPGTNPLLTDPDPTTGIGYLGQTCFED